MKAIRISLYVIGGLVVLLVLAVAIFAATFDPNRYKGEIERLVKDRTGRTLQLKGNLQVAVWPSLGANVNGVARSGGDSHHGFLLLATPPAPALGAQSQPGVPRPRQPASPGRAAAAPPWQRGGEWHPCLRPQGSRHQGEG